jgi:hypothetical protein
VEYWTCGQDNDPRNWNWKPWHHLERLCRKRGLDDFAVREILFEHQRGIWNASARSYLMRGNCERRLSKGNSGLILRAVRSECWIKTGTAEPFSTEMRNGIWNFEVRRPDRRIFGLGKKVGLWT